MNRKKTKIKNVKNTLGSSGEDVELHSLRVCFSAGDESESEEDDDDDDDDDSDLDDDDSEFDESEEEDESDVRLLIF